jgi:two-component system phosphate regulon sensor histidine kinase PhoR
MHVQSNLGRLYRAARAMTGKRDTLAWLWSYVPPGKVLVFTAALSAPAAVALVVLVALGRLDGGTALIAMAGIAIGIGILTRFGLGGFAAVKAYLDAVASGGDPGPVPLSAGVAADLAASVARSQRQLTHTIEQLEERVQSAERILDRIPAPLILIDAQNTVVGANAAARKFVGGEPVGRALSLVLRDPGVLDAVAGTLSGLGTREAEFSVAAPVERDYLARVSPLAADIAGRAAAVISLQDLTAAKQIDRTRADFVANVSHELRTPLSTLIGFIETLRGPASEDETARSRFLTIMQEQAERMSRLIRDLMSLSRIEMHEHSPPTKRVDLTGVVQTVAELMQIKAGEKGIRFKLDVPSEPAAVIGDDDELTQVLQNLVDNAIKYSRPDSTVEIAIRREAKGIGGGQIAVAVSDQGEGIPIEHLPRLTERFYRVDAARSRKLGGTGLGLAIVKHIVNRHGGVLAIDSVEGEGSTFTVQFPAAAADMARQKR